jgi:hypothetical protein
MKKIAILSLLLAVGTYAGAQTLDTVRIVSRARKFRPSQNILLMFEVMDTVDASAKKITMSRSYYFNKQTRKLGSVREDYNFKSPQNASQVIYSFGENKLTAVTVIPPRSTCTNCASQYYYANDSLSSKRENQYTSANPATFINHAQSFQSKLPHELPWGHFDGEVIVNGRKKKIRRQF